ncbi:heparanase-like isoform X2 [Dreissena polymorpha]|uniref:Heparanase n=1 Tax=Dreissena polymorpha TaxID=45954 RepID=A0A9D4EYP1_DREPO|nr:heparanase-like isoform X2 [Dreissena polymorpha]KAH3788144.1 hypothetical protein DPMN_166276 [Dreissena polymorpha]
MGITRHILFVFSIFKVVASVEISLDTTQLIFNTSDKFLSVAIDSGIIRRNWEKFNPRSPLVKLLASALGPCYLRMGGTDADFLIFKEKDDSLSSAKPSYLKSQYNNIRVQDAIDIYKNNSTRVKRRSGHLDQNGPNINDFDVGYDYKKDLTNFTMTGQFFDEAYEFVSSVGWDFIFDLNLLQRQNDRWDPSNAMELMNYTLKHGYKMAGWELGNEPDNYEYLFGNYTLPPPQYVRDFVLFRSLVYSYPEFSNLLLIGPSVTQPINKGIIYYKSFLESGGGDVVTAASFHQYYIDGRTATIDQFYDPEVLNVLQSELATGVTLTRAAHCKAPIWLGETSSAWGGGAEGLSDRYVAGFMWLDKLGLAASLGVDVVIRQSFYGGHYALLDQLTLEPNPDYWLSLLYKTLVGRGVVRVTSPESTGKLRVYAHCTNTVRSGYPAGSVTVYVLNMGSVSCDVSFADFPSNSPVHVYMMTAADGDLTSQSVLLNGVPLEVAEGRLPDLLTPVKTTRAVSVPALTYAFIVLPDAGLQMCVGG